MSKAVQSPYIWVAKRSSNFDSQQVKSKTKSITLDKDDQHPLQKKIELSSFEQRNPSGSKGIPKDKSKDGEGFVDPLTAMSVEADEFYGPLRLKGDFDGTETFFDSTDSSNSDSSTQESFWRCLEGDVISEGQTFDGKIEIPSTLHYLLPKMDEEEGDESLTSISARLEWLEAHHQNQRRNSKAGFSQDFPTHLLNVNQFINFIEITNNQLARYWKDDQRVSVVKLVIQATKMLAEPDPQALTYYPAMFFALADLVTYFGQLVYDRLVSKCPGLRINFTLADVSDAAKELCKNWIYKIASIRELVPRFYLETSLLRCYRFSCNVEGFPALIERLILMIRGIGDPVVASYASVYLSYAVQQALQSSSPQLVRNVARKSYGEFLSIFRHIGQSDVFERRSLKLHDYVLLFSPAVRWFLAAQTVGLATEESQKDEIYKRCLSETDNLDHRGLLLNHIMECFSQNSFADESTFLCQLVTTTEDLGYPKHLLLRTFGRKLVEHSTGMSTKTRSVLLGILNRCWKLMTKMTTLDGYLRCAEVFVQFCTQHFGHQELDVLLGDVLAHVTTSKNQYVKPKQGQQHLKLDSQTEEWMATLVSIIKQSLCIEIKAASTSQPNMSMMVAHLKSVMPLIDCLDSKTKVTISREILEYLKQPQDEKVSADPDSILHLAGILADSINALTIQDETRQISQLICSAINDLDFRTNYDRKLKFLTECRSKLIRLESVQVHLIYIVMGMAMDAVRSLNSKSELAKRKPRLQGFLQACCAYAFITIPSVSNVITKLKLYLLTAQVGYHTRCLGQAEDCLFAVVSLLKILADENKKTFLIGKDTQSFNTFLVYEFVPNFCNYLLVAPDIPKKEDFLIVKIMKELLRSLKSILAEDHWSFIQANLSCLKVLSIAAWTNYPFHIDGIDSSDVVILGSFSLGESFQSQLNKLSTSILEQLLLRLQNYDNVGDEASKQKLAANLLDVIIQYCILDDPNSKTPSLCIKLWKIMRSGNIMRDVTLSRKVRQWKQLPGARLQIIVEKMETDLTMVQK